MPSFGSMTPRQHAIMDMAHSLVTYAVMDEAKVTPMDREAAVRRHGERDIDRLEETGWVEVIDGKIHVTDAGRKHLSGF